MFDESRDAFRQCSCRAPGCGFVFFICPSCERGQVYCSQACRDHARRLQRRAANRRHQQSPEGRLDHRDRQRTYRRRRASLTKNVTDHTSATSPADARMGAPAFSAVGLQRRPAVWDRRGVICRVCGRRGRFVNPFDTPFERRMRR